MPAARWKGLKGYVEMTKLLDGSAIQLVTTEDEWIDLNVNKNSKLRFRCSTCNLDAISAIHNVARLKRIGCLCTGRFKWKTPQGKKLLLHLISRTRFTLECDVDELELKGEDSRVPLRCTVCDSVVHPRASRFRATNGGAIGCKCHAPEHLRVFMHVEPYVHAKQKDLVVVNEFAFNDELVGPLNRRLRSDIGILGPDNRVLGIVEIDGFYHFASGSGDRLECHNRTHRYDLVKEQWCRERRIPMIRISDKCVTHGTWHSRLEDALDAVIDGRDFGVRCIDCDGVYSNPKYAYARLRMGVSGGD